MVKIIDTEPRHIDDILELEKRCFSMPWTREQLVSQLPDDMHIFLTAEDECGGAIGYIGLMYVLDEGYISNVAVSPEHRRQGIADMLLDELRLRAQAKRLSFLTLEVRQSNMPARDLYKKHGYTEVGLRRNYYSRPTENAVLMTLFLREEEQ